MFGDCYFIPGVALSMKYETLTAGVNLPSGHDYKYTVEGVSHSSIFTTVVIGCTFIA